MTIELTFPSAQNRAAFKCSGTTLDFHRHVFQLEVRATGGAAGRASRQTAGRLLWSVRQTNKERRTRESHRKKYVPTMVVNRNCLALAAPHDLADVRRRLEALSCALVARRPIITVLGHKEVPLATPDAGCIVASFYTLDLGALSL